MEKLTYLRIQRVANGYSISSRSVQGAEYVSFDDVYVFETFDNLVKWMRENLEQNNERKPE